MSRFGLARWMGGMGARLVAWRLGQGPGAMERVLVGIAGALAGYALATQLAAPTLLPVELAGRVVDLAWPLLGAALAVALWRARRRRGWWPLR